MQIWRYLTSREMVAADMGRRQLSIFVQCLFVAAFSFVSSYCLWTFNIRSVYNLIWMIFLPFAIALICNKGAIFRARMAVTLGALSFLSIGAAAAFIGYP